MIVRIPNQRHCNPGFSLIELAAVCAILALIMGIMLPSLQDMRRRAFTITCRNNERNLSWGWFLYEEEHDGRMVPNNPDRPPLWTAGNMQDPKDAANPGVLEKGQLFEYTDSRSVYQCPADRTRWNRIRRARGYSLNCQMNGKSFTPGIKPLQHFDDILFPGPEKALLFLDDHAATAKWGDFELSARGEEWIHFPSARHSRGANLSFADGHVEYWQWQDRRTLNLPMEGRQTPANPDLKRIQAILLGHP